MTTALAFPESTELVGRAQLTLTAIAQAWRRGYRGQAYVDALKTFLAGLRSPNTRKQYALGLNEFFEWCESETGTIPAPHEVTRERAIKYTNWLRNRTAGLDEHRLKKDPSRKLDYEIYRFVKGKPGTNIDAIRERLLVLSEFTVVPAYRPNEAAARLSSRVLRIEERDPEGLNRYLGCLVQRRLLRREPTIADIRSGRVVVPGIDVPSQAQLTERVPAEVFTYRIHERTTPPGPARASSVQAHLSALTSFWSYLIRSGENTPGQTEPLLKYNIWEAIASQNVREAKAQQEASRALKTPALDVFNRLLGTTYGLSPDGNIVASRDFEDVRDRAILMFVLYVAGRANEIVSLRRSSVQWGAEPLVSILGKGNKERVVRLPDAAYQAILDLTAKLEELADHAERQKTTDIAQARRLLAPNAPLFPPVSRWGCNATSNRRTELPPIAPELDPKSVAHMLHRRAEQAGFERGSPPWRQSHPHGFRHLAAQLARDAGTPLPVIQSVLGHSSLAVTGIYTEVRDPRAKVLFGWSAPSVAAAAVPPPSAPIPAEATSGMPMAQPVIAPPIERPPGVPAPAKRVIETVGVPAEPPPKAPLELVETGGPLMPAVTPAAPPLPVPPPEERLTAVGQLEARLEPAERRALAELDRIYEWDWGEPGNHSNQLVTGKPPAGHEGFATLLRCRAGWRSGLTWWTGPSGKLARYMPVMAPDQVAGEESAYGSVRDRLGQLWSHWMTLTDEGKGPTSAFALLAWIRVALDVTYDVQEEVDRRGGRWVPYAAPLETTELPRGESERHVFREQRDDQIADWFGRTAWQYRQSRGRTATGGRAPRVVDMTIPTPSWYALEDPLSELYDNERDELFDWIRVLTGKPPTNRVPIFGKASRRDLGEVLGLWCLYDASRAELRQAQHDGEDRDRLRQLQENVEVYRESANAKVRSLTGKPFDVKAAVDKRVGETRRKREMEAIRKQQAAEGDEEGLTPLEKREHKRKFYMRLLGELFGKEAGTDDILTLFAYCNQDDAPLSGWLYPQIFNIQGKTIVHSASFAREFARETGGAHSECVARRMARELWELRKAWIEAKKAGHAAPRLVQRPEELVAWLHAMAYFKVPCPKAMERELRSRLSDTSPLPLYEEWQTWRDKLEERRRKTHQREAERSVEAKRTEEAGGVASEFAEPAERYREEIFRDILPREEEEMVANARIREYTYRPNMRRYVPSPVVLLFCIYAR